MTTSTQKPPPPPMVVVPPDGGWGWVIVCCSFLIHMLVVGTLYALSVLYVAWLDHFQTGKGLTSWVLSLAVAVMFAIGPLPGSLSKRFGNRAVVIMGGLVTALGFFSSAFAPNVYYLVVSVGLVTGTGAGCCFLPSVSMVAMYFTSRRSMAMGIAASGLGVGAFFMAPFLNWLVDVYGWRGCMLILSGISLNMCVLGTLMLPVEQAPRVAFCGQCCAEQNSQCDQDTKQTDGDDTKYSSLPYCDTVQGDGSNFMFDEFHQKQELPPKYSLYSSVPRIEIGGPEDDVVSVDEDDSKDFHQKRPLDSDCRPNQAVPLLNDSSSFTNVSNSFKDSSPCAHVDDYQLNGEELQNRLNKYVHVLDTAESSTDPESALREGGDMQPTGTSVQTLGAPGQGEGDHALQGTKGGSLQALTYSVTVEPVHKPYSSNFELSASSGRGSRFQPPNISLTRLNDLQVMLAGSVSSFIFLNSQFTSLLSVVSKPSLVTAESGLNDQGSTVDGHTDSSSPSRTSSSLSVYIRLFRHSFFMWFCVSNFLTNLSFFMPVLYMVDRAVDYGISKADAAILISVYGAGNIVGKLGLGWLADRGFVDRLFYYVSCLTLCGVATCMSPMCGPHHWLHALYAFVFGFFIGGYVTLFPIVTVDLLGLADVGEAFGLLLAFMGVGIVLGTPVAGWIFDWTGSYTISFILHGGLIVLSAAMLVPLMVVRHRSRMNQKK